MSITDFIRPNIKVLAPYSTARDEFSKPLEDAVFIDANENPFGTFNRYPDPHQKRLKALISRIKGVPCENIFCGNGSDEAIDLVFRVFCTPGVDNVVAISPSYGMYSVCADINDVAVRSVLLEQDFSLDVDRLLGCIDERTKAVFLCSPNNPTGNIFPAEQILRIADSFRGLVVVDEAYIDFAGCGSIVGQALKRDNILVLQTLSKAWGMAGLRLGLAFGSAEVISYMSRVKYPYNINQAALDIVSGRLEQALESAADDSSVQPPCLAELLSERARVDRMLKCSPIFEKVYPTEANFILAKVKSPLQAGDIYDRLISRGIVVRNRDKVALCAGCLRISIGTPEENTRLEKALEIIAKETV